MTKRVAANQSVIVPGFKFAGISAGIKGNGAKDLALIYSECQANAAGVFTTNAVKAAPVRLAMEKLTRDKNGRAVIINSGNANACTGEQGLQDARKIMKKTASELGVPPGSVFVSSTGVIGRRLPTGKILSALPGLIHGLSASSINDSAAAIMTTDTFAKISSRKIRIGGKTGTIAGIAKGSGMICPNMATMLCFICTDIAASPAALDSALRESVNHSFNRVTVDNDMSTNDSVIILANGKLGNPRISRNSPFYPKLKDGLIKLTHTLAMMIAEDGEGATKFIEIKVRGARTNMEAERIARTVAGSMLVKTAVYGKDPNWGRIMAAIGYSGVTVRENRIDIYMNGVKLVSKGIGTNKEAVVARALAEKKVTITIDMGSGKASAGFFTCDLTEDYIKINAHYTT